MSLYPTFKTARSGYASETEDLVLPVMSSSVVQQIQSLYPVAELMQSGFSEVVKQDTNAMITTQDKSKSIGELRQMTLCKDLKGKVGFLVSEVNKGIFVSFVMKESPAAMVGLKFGDQILQINDTLLAGYSADKVHKIIKNCEVNKIHLLIRNRPLARNISLVKDDAGRVGFEYHNGKITNLVKDSSAARNGLTIDHQLLEVEGQTVVGMKDKEIVDIITKAGSVLTVTILPSFIYSQMTKKIDSELLKSADNTAR